MSFSKAQVRETTTQDDGRMVASDLEKLEVRNCQNKVSGFKYLEPGL